MVKRRATRVKDAARSSDQNNDEFRDNFWLLARCASNYCFCLSESHSVSILRKRMSELRRRVVGALTGDSPTSTPSTSRDASPAPGEDYRVVPTKQLQKLTKKKGSKRRNFWIFGLGGVFGILIAGFFASSNQMIDLAAFGDMNLDSMFDMLPAGLIKDAQDLQVSIRPRRLHIGILLIERRLTLRS